MELQKKETCLNLYVNATVQVTYTSSIIQRSHPSHTHTLIWFQEWQKQYIL